MILEHTEQILKIFLKNLMQLKIILSDWARKIEIIKLNYIRNIVII